MILDVGRFRQSRQFRQFRHMSHFEASQRQRHSRPGLRMCQALRATLPLLYLLLAALDGLEMVKRRTDGGMQLGP